MESENQNLLWRRPNNVPWPKVWHQFEVTHKSGQKYRIKIQDIPDERFDDVLDFLAIEFDKNEPITSSPTVAPIFNDENVRIALRKTRRKILEQKMSLFAVLDNNDETPEIMGLELHLVTSPDEPHIKVPSTSYENNVMEIVHEVNKNIDTNNLFQSREYITDFNLSVASKYYGLGISYHIFVALSKLASALNIGGAVMTFSSKFAQRSAEKAGFKLLKELKFDCFKDEDGKIKLDIKESDSIKVMYAKYHIHSNSTNI